MLVNGRTYRAPKRPTVVIVIDGFDPAYLQHGFANGTLPTMKSFEETGFVGIADCSIPSTTNTNNTSIVTGVPPQCMASTAITISIPQPAKK